MRVLVPAIPETLSQCSNVDDVDYVSTYTHDFTINYSLETQIVNF